MYKSDVEQSISECAVEPQRRRYVSLIRKQTGFDSDTAESIFQQCLFEAWKRRGEVRGDSFRKYFYSIVRRTCWAERNKARARLDNGKLPPEHLAPLECIDADPAQKIMVDQMLAALSPEDRKLITEWAESPHGAMPHSWQPYLIRKALREQFT